MLQVINQALTVQAIHESRARLEAAAGLSLHSLTEAVLSDNPDPLASLLNLEKWVQATGNPRLFLEQLSNHLGAAKQLAFLLGASQPIADTLIKNPELASLVLEPSEIANIPPPKVILAEGRRLLSTATSQAHALDRLRYLKQRYNLPIVAGDLFGTWEQETVWRALSDLADTIIQLTLEQSWGAYAASKGLPPEPPFSIVAFGKLGGREINYSSDVDLVYVAADGLDEKIERDTSRFCESLGRALSDKFGRGFLYRVDLRLRPYGAAGPIIRSIGSVEGYYRLYAEPWEIQALLKSRVIAGAPIAGRWSDLVHGRVYQPKISDATLAEMLATRKRVEEIAKGDDLKRGPGGIRDVEFVTQALQMVHGNAHPSIQLGATCDALRALSDEHLLDTTFAQSLIQSYTFLRKLEHRIQLLDDRQTHTIPESPDVRSKLARLMDMGSWPALESSLMRHRAAIKHLYQRNLKIEAEPDQDREALGKELGSLAESLWHWFNAFPEPGAYYRILLTDPESLDRVRRTLIAAPALVSQFRASLQMTELLLSGEFEPQVTETTPASKLAALPLDAPVRMVAETYGHARLLIGTEWILDKGFSLEEHIAGLMDAVIEYASRRFGDAFDIVALGSYGCNEPGPDSDADLLLLTDKEHPRAERAAQEFLGFLAQLKRYDAPLNLDLRLRPDGGKGLLVRTYDGFGAYEVEGMAMWERFALGHARLLKGSPETLDLVRHAAYALPLTPANLQELVEMKRRIESERIKPEHLMRDVKLGHGGLNDIEWIVHLIEMKYPEQLEAGRTSAMPDRIRALGKQALLNAFEVEALLEARTHLLRVRALIFYQQLKNDLVPENPDRLERLARACGLETANDFLRIHEPIVNWVRRLFIETLERLCP